MSLEPNDGLSRPRAKHWWSRWGAGPDFARRSKRNAWRPKATPGHMFTLHAPLRLSVRAPQCHDITVMACEGLRWQATELSWLGPMRRPTRATPRPGRPRLLVHPTSVAGRALWRASGSSPSPCCGAAYCRLSHAGTGSGRFDRRCKWVPERLEMVRPPLHEFGAFREPLRTLVRAPDVIPFFVRQLLLNDVRIPSCLVRAGREEGAKSMCRGDAFVAKTRASGTSG